MLNGPGGMDGRQRYLGNLNLSFAYVEGESLLMGLKVRGRACVIMQRPPSQVLLAARTLHARTAGAERDMGAQGVCRCGKDGGESHKGLPVRACRTWR